MKFPDVLYDAEIPNIKVKTENLAVKEKKKQKGIMSNMVGM